MNRHQDRGRPIRFHRKDGGLSLFAGLDKSWFPKKNQPQVTFTIVTCAANGVIAPIHDRMPMVLDERGADDCEHRVAKTNFRATPRQYQKALGADMGWTG